ncbi:MAG: ROK family protein [Thermofilum sp.]|nr:ROK family protein [Thermofilum sp.]
MLHGKTKIGFLEVIVLKRMRYAVAVDVGATRTRVALGNEDGELLELEVFPTHSFATPDEYLGHIARLAKTFMERNGVDIVGIGVGSPGPIDMERGEVIRSINLPFEKLEVVRGLKSLTGKKIAFANDAVTAAVGEKYFGAGRACQNLVYITISTGIGGGVYVDGTLLLGKQGNAHEIGHIVVDLNEEITCGCGKRGHWEAYCSGTGIPKYTKLLSYKHPDLWNQSILRSKEAVTAKDVFEAYRSGDSFARLVIQGVKRFNACGFAAVVNAYDPEIITVGGSVALNNADILLTNIEREVENYAVNIVPKIIATPLGDKIGIMGALALGLGKEDKVPLR